jgi:hypothetical protein
MNPCVVGDAVEGTTHSHDQTRVLRSELTGRLFTNPR